MCAPQQEGQMAWEAAVAPPLPSVLLYASLCFPAQHLWALQGHAYSISYEATSMGICITVYQLDFLIRIYFTNQCFTNYLIFLIVVVVSLVYAYVKTHQIVHFKQLCLINLLKRKFNDVKCMISKEKNVEIISIEKVVKI